MPNEQQLSILMADLSGYTAMTEVHGAESAIRVVGRYLGLAERSLKGSAKLIERVGDQLVIVSANPFDIADTAIALMQYSRDENLFLQVHAGIHYGPVVESDGSYFGTAMNLTSRVASRAKAGSILCTEAFIKQLEASPGYQFQKPQPVIFKNLLHPVITAEMVVSGSTGVSKLMDPVCRMQLDTDQHYSYSSDGKEYHFCSEECLSVFKHSHVLN